MTPGARAALAVMGCRMHHAHRLCQACITHAVCEECLDRAVLEAVVATWRAAADVAERELGDGRTIATELRRHAEEVG